MLLELGAPLAAFNLVCTVTAVLFDHNRQPGPNPTIEYHVDLGAGRFCTGPCTESRPIAQITPTDLYLAASRDQKNQNAEFIKVSRESGGYVWILGYPPGEIRMVGRCDKHPFSGLPKPKF